MQIFHISHSPDFIQIYTQYPFLFFSKMQNIILRKKVFPGPSQTAFDAAIRRSKKWAAQKFPVGGKWAIASVVSVISRSSGLLFLKKVLGV